MSRSFFSVTCPQSILVLLALVAVTGCSQSKSARLVSVSGRVTWNGQPLSNANVYFYPTAGGRPSYAQTGKNGEYRLRYDESRFGAIAGSHTVKISTYVEPDVESAIEAKQKGAPEEIPEEYNQNSTLVAELSSTSSATLDFKLQIAR